MKSKLFILILFVGYFTNVFGEVLDTISVSDGKLVLDLSSEKTGKYVPLNDKGIQNPEIIVDIYNVSLHKNGVSYSILEKSYARIDSNRSVQPLMILSAVEIDDNIYILYSNMNMLMLERVLMINNTFTSVDSELLEMGVSDINDTKISKIPDDKLLISISRNFSDRVSFKYSIKKINTPLRIDEVEKKLLRSTE